MAHSFDYTIVGYIPMMREGKDGWEERVPTELHELLRGWSLNQAQFEEEGRQKNHGDTALNEASSEGEEESKEEVKVGLATSNFVEVNKGVVDQEIGDGDLGVKTQSKTIDINVPAKGGDKAGNDGSGQVKENGESDNGKDAEKSAKAEFKGGETTRFGSSLIVGDIGHMDLLDYVIPVQRVFEWMSRGLERV